MRSVFESSSTWMSWICAQMGVELGVPEFICSNLDDVLPSWLSRDVEELKEDICAPIPNIVSESIHFLVYMIDVTDFWYLEIAFKNMEFVYRVAVCSKKRRKRPLRFVQRLRVRDNRIVLPQERFRNVKSRDDERVWRTFISFLSEES